MTQYITCPLPRSHPSNIFNRKKNVDDILAMIRRRQTRTIDDNGFYIFDEPAAYGKLYKRRKKPKLREHRTNIYVIMDTDARTLAAFKTKAEAVRAFAKDRIRAIMFGRPMSKSLLINNNLQKINEIPLGALLLKVPAFGVKRINTDEYDHLNKFVHTIDSKKCQACPNAGQHKNRNPDCHCSLIGFIRDSTPGWHYWSRHAIKMKKKAYEKKLLKDGVRPDTDPWLKLY